MIAIYDIFPSHQETYLVATDTDVPLDLSTLPGKTGLAHAEDQHGILDNGKNSSRSRRASSQQQQQQQQPSDYTRCLVWQWEIESRLVSAAPFCAVVIYDSCRDSAATEVDAALTAARAKVTKEAVDINMVIGYGTRWGRGSIEHANKQ